MKLERGRVCLSSPKTCGALDRAVIRISFAKFGRRHVQGELHGQQLPPVREDCLPYRQNWASQGLLFFSQRLLQMRGMQLKTYPQGKNWFHL
jgi:hypothetical protein